MKIDLARRSPAIDRQRQRLAVWWRERSEREQILLGVLGGLALLWVSVVLIAQPLWNARSAAVAEIRTYDSLGARLAQAGPLNGRKIAQRGGSPANILTASAAEVGLAPQITPEGASYRVVLSDAPYDAVIQWVAEVERGSHLRFVGMRIDRRPVRGYVSASFVVRG